MDMISHVKVRQVTVIAMLSAFTAFATGCNQQDASTSQSTGTAVAATTAAIPVTASIAPSASAGTAAAATTAATPVTASVAPTNNSSSSLPASAPSGSGTSSWQYGLISSGGQIVNANTLDQGNSMSAGSTGANSRPELEGADMTPLTVQELVDMNTNTPAARIIYESILGADTRFQVNPSSYPERAVSLITYNGNTHCTGWLISKDTLITAGHCVHGGGISGKWGSTSAFRIYPGYSDGYAPYGFCDAKELYSSSGWVMSRDSDADIGLIKLNCSVGNSTGYFGYFVADPVDNTTVTINGYPGDKADARQQWASYGTISRSTPSKIYYDNDTTGGMSGSPVWVRNNGTAWALGIHTNGEDSVLSPNSNSGTRISQDIFDLMTAVKNLP